MLQNIEAKGGGIQIAALQGHRKYVSGLLNGRTEEKILNSKSLDRTRVQ